MDPESGFERASRCGRLNAGTLVYRLRRPLMDGRTKILLEPLEFLARLVDLLTPPRRHRHRYCGVLVLPVHRLPCPALPA
jgi:hypothetical protein